MTSTADRTIGRAFYKRKFRRVLYELFGNYKYSTPALNGLDQRLVEHISARIQIKDGFFIEAGANDGFNQSNTYYLAHRYNWKGILVEPIPELADHCRAIRNESAIECCLLGSPESDGASIDIHRAGLMSTVNGAFSDEATQQEHLRRAVEIQPGIVTGTIRAPVRTLSSIIDQHRPDGHVDLLSLDVEGYEVQALAGLDMSRHRPRFICIEAKDPEAIDKALAEHYQQTAQLSHHDRLYESIESINSSGA